MPHRVRDTVDIVTQPWTDPPCPCAAGRSIELRLLLVGQRSVERVERRAHRLHRLQHDVEPFADRGKPGRRRHALSGWHEALSMSAALAAASCSAARLARWASFGWTLGSISAAGQSVKPGCAIPRGWATGSAAILRRLDFRADPGLNSRADPRPSALSRAFCSSFRTSKSAPAAAAPSPPPRSSPRCAAAWPRAGSARSAICGPDRPP